MEEAIEQQQIQNQNQNQSPKHTQEELGFESQTPQTSLLPSDLNIQNPNQNQPNENDDEDEMAMQIICEDLRDLVLNQALDKEREKEDLHHLDPEENGKINENEVENVEGNDDGWGDVGEYGDYHYDEENRSGSVNGNDNENDGEKENGYEGDSKEGGGFNANNRIKKKFIYPLRPDAQDCPYFMKTGVCKFGFNCKFNHPSRRKYQQGTKEKGKQREESQERPGQIECKYYLTSGGCKYGKACKFNHSREKGSISPIAEFNFLGLPIRPGEKECPYYMRTGSCKYGSNCRFHHPDPTTVAGADRSSGYNNGGAVPVQAASHPAASSWSSPRALNDTAPYVPMMYPPTQGIPSPNTEWNGYQAPVYPTAEKRLPTPPAFGMNNPATKTNYYPRPLQPLLVEEYPERPGQPDCSYFIKTGDCKYKFNCKFHHPKSRVSKANSSTLNEKGLPLRPDQTVCSFYSRYGICKFGPACKFDHPENYVGSGSSTEYGFDQPQQSQMSLGWQGRELEVDR
ncbi:zinc finger CCCH domain-containing protein 67 isoform X2 [Nicotiana sylvestris]|uniref:Zinc finger CCCH domain-containing protein 67 isoform X2 n=1 Tax=Nicotiana sylvestris TaxID=4096 RepID=A0A1U7XG91_NICSY|nr:PREDICTED: zinc finger CCCH domain-containing protein 67 isoform X2 [Nicotiana sylvestris]